MNGCVWTLFVLLEVKMFYLLYDTCWSEILATRWVEGSHPVFRHTTSTRSQVSDQIRTCCVEPFLPQVLGPFKQKKEKESYKRHVKAGLDFITVVERAPCSDRDACCYGYHSLQFLFYFFCKSGGLFIIFTSFMNLIFNSMPVDFFFFFSSK